MPNYSVWSSHFIFLIPFFYFLKRFPFFTCYLDVSYRVSCPQCQQLLHADDLVCYTEATMLRSRVKQSPFFQSQRSKILVSIISKQCRVRVWSTYTRKFCRWHKAKYMVPLGSLRYAQSHSHGVHIPVVYANFLESRLQAWTISTPSAGGHSCAQSLLLWW